MTLKKGYSANKKETKLTTSILERKRCLSQESVTILIACGQNLRNRFIRIVSDFRSEQNQKVLFLKEDERRPEFTKNENKNGHLISIYLKVDINRTQKKTYRFQADSKIKEF